MGKRTARGAARVRAVAVDRRRGDRLDRDAGQTRRKTRVPLVPPKPKEFDRATSTLA